MAPDILNFFYFSDLLHLPVVSLADGKTIGRIIDLAATTGQVYPRITGLITKVRWRKNLLYIPWNKVKRMGMDAITVENSLESPGMMGRASENEILLRQTFLDRQIISTSGHKVVRVNDLHLLIESSSKESPNLWLVHIDVGIKGIFRRLGWLPFLNSLFRWVYSRDLRDKFVSWKFVQPTSTTNVYGSLHLKVDSSRLSEMHPADLADILEDLGTDERISLIESLDPKTAAPTLQEIPIKIRVQVAETLDPSRLAAILNEMPMNEIVDLLDEIAPGKRAAVFSALSPEQVTEIKELSKLSAFSVGRLLKTDYLTARPTQRAKDALEIVRTELSHTEVISYVYIVDEENHLRGVVTLRKLLVARPEDMLSELMRENVVTVEVDTSIKRVAQIFFKYNFVAVPVVDEENKIQGIVTLRETLESVFPEVKEESGG